MRTSAGLLMLVSLACIATVGCGSREIDRLVAQLSDPNPHVRRAAADALGEHAVDADRVIPPLEGALGDPDPSVRLAAALSLARIEPQNENCRPVILAALAAGQAPIFLQIGRLKPPADWAVPTLVALLDHARPQIRALAAQALGQIGVRDAAVESALRQHAADENAAVRKAAGDAIQLLAP